jgi:hypothetical protein
MITTKQKTKKHYVHNMINAHIVVPDVQEVQGYPELIIGTTVLPFQDVALESRTPKNTHWYDTCRNFPSGKYTTLKFIEYIKNQ